MHVDPNVKPDGNCVIVPVFLQGFGEKNPIARNVHIPPHEATEDEVSRLKLANLVFKYGQNDFQPANARSVSVGDTFYIDNYRIRVDAVGFSIVSYFTPNHDGSWKEHQFNPIPFGRRTTCEDALNHILTALTSGFSK